MNIPFLHSDILNHYSKEKLVFFFNQVTIQFKNLNITVLLIAVIIYASIVQISDPQILKLERYKF